ncbi:MULTISPECIES: 2OG-Fe(II) oxygenase [unclassified Iodidimonas]|uniref:2OG-Fe(II) oxygenase n=1 Tax=unclassified Iodidimonas TaxID=2626145 RepID=UPI0024827C5B|nr:MULTISPECIES: 2OG-Fe(II) oxygenase [unclassified Iodidimonas]
MTPAPAPAHSHLPFGGEPPFSGSGAFFIARPDAFSKAECAILCGLMEDATPKAGRLTGGQTVESIRACEILWLDDQPETSWIFERLARIMSDINNSAFGFQVEGFNEGAQLIRYDGHERGTYDWHADRGRAPGTRTRKLSISVQITPPDDYEGGCLELNGEGSVITAPRTEGTAIVFPSFVLHRISPVTKGRRTALVAWLHGPAFR